MVGWVWISEKKCNITKSAKLEVTIKQKVLVTGLTQMECDSMCSTVNKKIKAPMNLPHDYLLYRKTQPAIQSDLTVMHYIQVVSVHNDIINEFFFVLVCLKGLSLGP